jgi:hypothetical protein
LRLKTHFCTELINYVYRNIKRINKSGLIKLILAIGILLTILPQLNAQQKLRVWEKSPTFNKKRLYLSAGSQAGLYGFAMVGFNELRYRNDLTTKLHWFNNNNEWLMVDKIGHTASSYRVGQISTELLYWAGVDQQKAVLYGSFAGLIATSSIELLDAKSVKGGASWGNLIGNCIGTGLLIGQYQFEDKQIMNIKLSAHYSEFAQYRPSVLGSSTFERVFKDYNGQTYWLSVGMNHLIPVKKIPDWLNIAFGYGAEGMTGGISNPVINEQGEVVPYSDRYRQYYLSLDIELRKIPFKSSFMRAISKIFSYVKIPAPALSFSKKGIKGHYIYY